MTMKKIIIDGGPRATFNTASMLKKLAEGDGSVSNEIEVKTRLYALDYKGCMSCMACKIKGKASNVCKFKDALTPVLEEIAQADGLGGSNCNGYGTMEPCIAKALGQPEKLFANNTYQVKNYANFELGGFSEEAKRKYRKEHWQQDLQNAFDFGKTMAEKIIGC